MGGSNSLTQLFYRRIYFVPLVQQSCLDERGFWGLPADAVSDVRLRAIEQQVEDDEERVEPGDD